MIGSTQRARELLDGFSVMPPNEARVMALVAEAYEDLGDREAALTWIGRALENGLGTDWIEERPALSRLEEDERYQDLEASGDGT
jgi:hypothetical protein